MDDGSGVPQEVVDENGNLITVIRPRQKAMKNIFSQHDLSEKDIEGLSFFARVYRFLHDPASSFLARAWSVLMVIAIITSSIMILLQSMPNLRFLDSIENITYYVEVGWRPVDPQWGWSSGMGIFVSVVLRGC